MTPLRRLQCSTLALICALVAVARAGPASIPEGLTTCALNDPEINTCLKNSITNAFPIVADGLPTLGIPSIDPLDIKQLVIGEGTGAVKMNLEFNDLQLIGLRKAYMESVKFTKEPFTIDGRCKFNDVIILTGPYKVSGSVLVLPITGEGLANFTLANLIADIHVVGEPYTKGGETYMKIHTFDLKLTVSHLDMRLSNLFNGDEALGKTMISFLNENWSEIYKELEPAFEATLGASFLQVAARFFQKVPYTQIFPEK